MIRILDNPWKCRNAPFLQSSSLYSVARWNVLQQSTKGGTVQYVWFSERPCRSRSLHSSTEWSCFESALTRLDTLYSSYRQSSGTYKKILKLAREGWYVWADKKRKAVLLEKTTDTNALLNPSTWPRKHGRSLAQTSSWDFVSVGGPSRVHERSGKTALPSKFIEPGVCTQRRDTRWRPTRQRHTLSCW
jgi:hypothetical protein